MNSSSHIKGNAFSRDQSTGRDHADHRDQSQGEPHSIGETLQLLEEASEDREEISLGDALDAIGQHSFAPLLLLPGLIMALPGPADLPGVPVILGLLVIIVAVQMVLKREHLWIPGWMEKRRVRSETVKKMVRWGQRPASWIDRLTKKRFTALVDHAGYAAIAIACILIAAATPVLEFVPFSANIAGAAIVVFALALMARDGLLAGLAILLSLGVIAMIGYQFV
ncbi:exopolysaccharide biosynthesis protein [Novipirellula caenicola]